MYCIRCGKQISDGVKYCMYCGAPTEEGKKAQAKTAMDTTSIPTDFFSRRMQEKEDDFTIAIPRDFIQKPTSNDRGPDPAGEIDYTQMVSREDIARAMKEQHAAENIQLKEDIESPEGVSEPLADIADIIDLSDTKMKQETEQEAYTQAISTDHMQMSPSSLPEEEANEIESLEYSRVISKEEVQQAVAELDYRRQAETEEAVVEMETDDIESEEYTQVFPKMQYHQAAEEDENDIEEESDATQIPDIPIPDDFMTAEPEPEEQVYANSDEAARRYREEPEEDEDEDGSEQLISVRGIVLVAVVVIALFAIAIGAVVMALHGGNPQDAGSGSEEAGISFSYGESED